MSLWLFSRKHHPVLPQVQKSFTAHIPIRLALGLGESSAVPTAGSAPLSKDCKLLSLESYRLSFFCSFPCLMHIYQWADKIGYRWAFVSSLIPGTCLPQIRSFRYDSTGYLCFHLSLHLSQRAVSFGSSGTQLVLGSGALWWWPCPSFSSPRPWSLGIPQ